MYSGQVKSYSPSKGYGFIIGDGVDRDVFFQTQSLPAELQAPEVYTRDSGFQLKEYQVSFDLVQTADGKPQAQKIILSNPGGMPYIGVVKSWNANKGYGFLVSSMMEGQDVWFGKMSVPPDQQFGNLQGTTAIFSVKTTPEGKPQANDMVLLGGHGQEYAAPPAMPQPRQMMRQTMQPMMRQMMQPMMHQTYQKPMQKMMPQAMMGGPPGVSEGQGMNGIVKSFSPENGYGFISAHGCPSDIYFKDETDQFTAGSAVSFTVHITPNGKVQGVDVQPGLKTGQELVGTVKSYNKEKGYGFIVVPDQTGDIYFKKDLVPIELQDADLKGTTVRFTLGTQPDGKPVMQEGEFLDRPPRGYAAPPMQQKRPAPSNGFGGGMQQQQQQAWQPTAKRQRVSPGSGNGYPQGKGVHQKGGGKQLTGVVKSYNGSKGFGFINCPQVPGDIYFKGDFPELTGHQVSFRLHQSPEGKPQGLAVQML